MAADMNERSTVLNVVLDTNIFVSDFQMSGSSFRLLLDAVKRAGYTLYVPQIVIEETVAKYREILLECRKKMRDQALAFKRHTGKDLPVISEDKALSYVDCYKSKLLQKLEIVDAKIYEYPDIGHDELAAMAINRKKPFSHDGRGYRDALIWKSICEIASSEGAPVVFITKNTKDFSEQSTDPDQISLHSDLCRDLKENGLTTCDVMMLSGLDVFVEKHIKPNLDALNEVKTQLTEGTYPGFNFKKEVELAVREMLFGATCDAAFLDLPNELGQSIIQLIGNPPAVKISDVLKLNESDLLIKAEVEVMCLFVFEGAKSEQRSLVTDTTSAVNDSGNNEVQTALEVNSWVHVEFSLILNTSSREITSAEMERAYPYKK